MLTAKRDKRNEHRKYNKAVKFFNPIDCALLAGDELVSKMVDVTVVFGMEEVLAVM